MPSIIYLSSARRDLAQIAESIEDTSQSRDTAVAFIKKLMAHCERFAKLPGLFGQARPELRPEYRSVTFGNYVIFFRYIGGESSRENVEIFHVVHGARDLEAFISRTYGA